MKTMEKVQPVEKDHETLLKTKVVNEKIKAKVASSLTQKRINPRLLIL